LTEFWTIRISFRFKQRMLFSFNQSRGSCHAVFVK
jgi:hypothetical protein